MGKGVKYFFGKASSATDQMIEEFNKILVATGSQ
jgi:hypothetical protein